MYKKATNVQLAFDDFNRISGLQLDATNRWIQRAHRIPWEAIEERYARLFPSRKGTVAKPLRMALGSLIIQKFLGCSDRELVEQIKENPYLQYFIGLAGYAYKRPFVPSLLVEFRKRLDDTVLAEINELIITSNTPEPTPPNDRKRKNRSLRHADEKTETAENRGILTLDATCAPQNIAFPQDTSLLNTAREKAEKLIRDLCKKEKSPLPRMYSKTAHRKWLNFARSRKRGGKKVRKAVKSQLQFLRRDIAHLHEIIPGAGSLTPAQYKTLRTIEAIYRQQNEMYTQGTHRAANRIVSFSQPYIRPIVRGKAKAPVEFGVKLDLSVTNGLCRVEYMSFDAYNEGKILKRAVQQYVRREGHYPERILADKLYRNRENLKFCKEHGIKLLGPALGRPRKDAETDKKQEYQDNRDRIEVERKFGLCKHSFGLGLLVTKTARTTLGSVLLSVISMNIDKLAKAFLSQKFSAHFCSYHIDSRAISPFFPHSNLFLAA